MSIRKKNYQRDRNKKCKHFIVAIKSMSSVVFHKELEKSFPEIEKR